MYLCIKRNANHTKLIQKLLYLEYKQDHRHLDYQLPLKLEKLLDSTETMKADIKQLRKKENRLQNHKGWNFLQEIKISMSSLSLSLSLNLVLNHYNASY